MTTMAAKNTATGGSFSKKMSKRCPSVCPSLNACNPISSSRRTSSTITRSSRSIASFTRSTRAGAVLNAIKSPVGAAELAPTFETHTIALASAPTIVARLARIASPRPSSAHSSLSRLIARATTTAVARRARAPRALTASRLLSFRAPERCWLNACDVDGAHEIARRSVIVHSMARRVRASSGAVVDRACACACDAQKRQSADVTP
mmetsp:Transcript_65/g.208  ORF Transcript_65/g.208 Transcript_65/m.208 type:complete len:206 (+) Transcript_65:219-836(+)